MKSATQLARDEPVFLLPTTVGSGVRSGNPGATGAAIGVERANLTVAAGQIRRWGRRVVWDLWLTDGDQ